MSTITIEIKAAELANAINNLAFAIDKFSVPNLSGIKTFTGCTEDCCRDTNAAESTPTSSEIKGDTVKTESQTVSDNSPTCSIEDVRAAFSAYAKKNGKDKAKEVLAKFGAAKVTEIKESDYNEVMVLIKN